MTDVAPRGVVETRVRILRTAGEVFATKGFKRATVRDICAKAGVNVAAVNYHFGGKEALYLETILYWKNIAFDKHPTPETGTQSSQQDPEGQLREFIRALVLRVLDEGDGSLFARLIAREHMEPTKAFDELVEIFVRPYFIWLSSLVARLSCLHADNESVRLCCASVVGQCLYFHYAKPVFERLFCKKHFSGEEMEKIADHIYRFTLGGLRQIGESVTNI